MAKLDLSFIDAACPPMRCDEGCDECCGVVAASKAEFDAVVAFAAARGITPVKQGSMCPWFQGGRCAVYEARPIVCRLFGHTPTGECPRGYNANMTMQALRDTVHRGKLAVIGAGDFAKVRLLHEVCMTPAEIAQAIDSGITRERVAELTVNGTKPLDRSIAEHRRAGREIDSLTAYAIRCKSEGVAMPAEVHDALRKMREGAERTIAQADHAPPPAR
jgi:Fe-S-cluster containining protein